MNEKCMQLIKFLLETKKWVTSSELAAELTVSVRTVKNYVSQLNTIYANLITSSSNGYRINTDAAASAMNDNMPSIPQSNKERSTYVAIHLLRSQKPLSFLDLCDTLFISTSTLRTVLKRTRRQLDQYDLELSMSGDSIEILGNERNRRRMLSSIIFEESNSAFFNMDVIQDAFDNIDADFVLDAMNETLLEGQYYVNDFSAFNILLHIIIAIDRNLNQTADCIRTELPPFIPAHVYDMAKSLAEKLEDYFKITFRQDEISEFSLLFYTRAASIAVDAINEGNLEEYIGRECMCLVKDINHMLQNDYGIELTNSESMVRFALHIKSLLLRTRTKNYNRNPLTDSIKTSCPLIYDAAVNLSSILTEKAGVTMIDDEIAYIALHIGNALETQHAYESRITVVLNCPTYYNINLELHQKLMERFHNEIIISDVTTTEMQLDHYPAADLILSTVPLNCTQKTPSIIINPFMTAADAAIIERAISQIRAEKKQQFFFKEMRKIILPEFYEHLAKPMSKGETIHHMCARLYEAGFSNEKFEDAILERERLSSTGFINFAIPHTMKMQENRSCMYILIIDEPMEWDDNSVHLVIMLCFSAGDRQIFNTIFESLSVSLLNRSMIHDIQMTQNYEDFLHIISKYNSRESFYFPSCT
ncbi:PRD domain-containing protein [Lachnospiraceae bacterium 54-53]